MKIRDLISILDNISKLNKKLNVDIFWSVINEPLMVGFKHEPLIDKARKIDAVKKFKEHINNLSDDDIIDIGFMMDDIAKSSYTLQELEMKFSVKELLLREQ
jgi:hypothetical protein